VANSLYSQPSGQHCRLDEVAAILQCLLGELHQAGAPGSYRYWIGGLAA